MIETVSIDQLKAIARACSDVLSSTSDPDTVAVPYLHILSAHPNSVSRYQDLLAGRSAWRQRVRNALVKAALRAFSLVNSSARFSGDEFPARTDVLFISHFVKMSQAAEGDDLYYGTVPGCLSNDGIQSVVALIDHTPRTRPKDLDWKRGAVPRVLLNRSVGLHTELTLGQRLTAVAKRFRTQRSRSPDAFSRAFLDHAAANASSSGAFAALRIGLQIEALVEAMQPKAIVTTFEGHSWERIAFYSARQARPGIICFGYHHSVLFPFSDAMRQKLQSEFNPDRILTAGDLSRDWLRQQPSLGDIPVDTIGSVRAPPDAATRPQSGSTCLILPEGLVSESVLLCRLAVATARACPNLIFRLRLHPVINRKMLLKAAPDLTDLPSNVLWSGAALNSDLQSSRWVLYRGSSAAITAALSGLRPIYFSTASSEINIDPMAALGAWRGTVSSARDLSAILDMDTAMSDRDRQESYEEARNQIQKYFTPLDFDAFKTLLFSVVRRTDA